MSLFQNTPIRRKITLIVLLTSGLGLSVASLALFAFQIFTFKQNYARDLAAIGKIVANNVTAALTFNDRVAAVEILDALEAKPSVLSASIRLKNGASFARYGLDFSDSELRDLGSNEGGITERFLTHSEPIILDREQIGTLLLVSDQRAVLLKVLKLDLLISGFVLALSIALVTALSARLQRVITKPIQDLAETAKQIAEERDYSVRATRRQNDEIGLYTDAFNRMLERIEEQDHAVRNSEEKYRSFFQGCPVSLWEEDFSEVKKEIDRLRSTGVSDFESYFREHPEVVSNFATMIKIVDVNQATLDLHKAESKEALFQGIDRLIGEDSTEILQDELVNFASGELRFQSEFVGLTLDGEQFHTLTDLSIPPGYKESWEKVFLSVVDITSRKEAEREFEDVHLRLLEASRQAGMAEVATGVLHNVGNVLNSVNVSASLVSDAINNSRGVNLSKVASLIEENERDLGPFLTTDPKGRKLPGYIRDLSDCILKEREDLTKELDQLRKNVEHIKDVVSMQQNYANLSGLVEKHDIVDLIEDAFAINVAGFERHGIEIIREFESTPPVLVDKHKVLQILVNLMQNSKYAVSDNGHEEKKIVLGVGRNDNSRAKITVQDNGVGIAPENLARVFSHGFTTRKDGHGFGLHSGANAAREMNGALSAYSDGVGCGATFTLELPIQEDQV